MREWLLFGKIAWRNVVRNRRRSTLTILGIMFGVGSLILFSGFIAGLYETLRELTIHSRIGHIQLSKPGYRDFGSLDPVKYTIKNYREIKAELSKIPGVVAVTKRFEYSGLLSNGTTTINFFANAIEPEVDAKANSALVYHEGRGPLLEDGNGVSVGQGVARKLHLKLGSDITLLVNYGGNSVNATDVRVTGIFESGLEEFDALAIKVPMNTNDTLIGTAPDDAHTVLVWLDETEHTVEVEAKIQAIVQQKGWDVEVKRWDILAPIYGKVVGLFGAIFAFIRLVVIMVIIFSVTNTVTMSVFERFREIGSLRAIGTSRKRVMRIFLMEGAIIGLMGGVIGAAVAMVLRLIVNKLGIYLPPPPILTLGSTVNIVFVPFYIVEMIIGATVTSFIASYLPARRAVKTEIVQSLRST